MEELQVPANVAPGAAPSAQAAQPQQNEGEDDGLPHSILLVKLGTNGYTKGGERGSFDATMEDLQNIIEDFLTRGKDAPIDYDHGTMDQVATANGDAPAAGWAHKLEIDPKKGLIAHVKSWTDKAKSRLQNKELRYTSPVLNFNSQNRPYALHSIALTNKPALHNPEQLMAANDEADKRNATSKSYKDTIASIHKSVEAMQALMIETLQSYSDYVKGDERLKADMTAFNDTVLGKSVRTFADIQSEIFEKRDSLSGPQMIDWLNQKKQSGISEVEANAIDSEINRLQTFQSQFPGLWDAGFTSGNERTADMVTNKPAPVAGVTTAQDSVQPTASTLPISALNDVAKVLKLNDTAKPEHITKVIGGLLEARDETCKFLSRHKAKSFSDVDKFFIDRETLLLNDNKKLKGTIALNDAKRKVKELIEENKIVEMQIPVMEKMALDTPAMFDDLAKTLKPRTTISSRFLNDLSDPAAPASVLTEVSDPELDRKAQMMGFKKFSDIKLVTH